MRSARILGVAAVLLAASGCVGQPALIDEDPESVRDPDVLPDSEVRPRADKEDQGTHRTIRQGLSGQTAQDAEDVGEARDRLFCGQPPSVGY